MKDKLEFLKLLADETRLGILNLLLQEDSYVEKLAFQLSLTPATICYHLKKMETAGLVNCTRSQFYMIYSLNKDIFNKPIYELVKKDSSIIDTEEKYKKEVLSHFFKYGKLTRLPAQKKKKEIVLQYIASNFEPDQEYDETEVNDMIHRFYDDHCYLRREMISCGIMMREKEKYRLI